MKKANNTPPEQENPRMPLTRRNYILLAVGFAVILLGFVLMAGGGSDSPDEFNYAMFSWRRITLAPILVIGGFVIGVIFKAVCMRTGIAEFNRNNLRFFRLFGFFRFRIF